MATREIGLESDIDLLLRVYHQQHALCFRHGVQEPPEPASDSQPYGPLPSRRRRPPPRQPARGPGHRPARSLGPGDGTVPSRA
eukprot:546501-Hanusia_phi.AAC.1